MEFLYEYGLFLAKTLTIVVAVGLIIAFAAAASMRHRGGTREHIEVKRLNDRIEQMGDTLRAGMLPKAMLKQRRKESRKKHKAESKKKDESRHRVFVIDFHGDLRCSGVGSLREEITAILTVARPDDEVVVKLESAGGMVHGYGLAASQLARVRDRNIPLTVAVDKVAASGGYLMACVANRIIAAPFAIIGSIGVISQLPNFHRLLKKHDIDFEQVTAGEYKRTVTLFGETTEKAREKLKQELEETHGLFKDFVSRYRPALDIDNAATGEYWLGSRAHELNLVDALQTSDDYIVQSSEERDIFEVSYTGKQNLIEKLSQKMRAVIRGASPDQELTDFIPRV